MQSTDTDGNRRYQLLWGVALEEWGGGGGLADSSLKNYSDFFSRSRSFQLICSISLEEEIALKVETA